MTSAALKVTSHVARDLLQSAGLFKHEHTVVWEYVSNGLEYVDPGVQPTVDVSIDVKNKKIVVRDNGRGMNPQDLERYFQMHGENIDRKKGKAGRGMFGTGKSAAFGVGDTLRLITVRNGLRSKVRLERKNIEAAMDGAGIPVEVLENGVPTTEPNGTVVEVDGIHLKKMDVGSVIRHIERHIAHWPNASVFVNHQPCKVTEPPYSDEKRISSKGTPFEATLGQVELVLKVAKAPLDSEWQGVAILSNGFWQTTTLAGCENKPFANYIFGEIEVPRLALDNSPIPAFDMSRSMQLNPRNEIVAQIFAFVGSNVDLLRKELEKKDHERRKDREAKKLLEEANEIARIINRDFDSWRNQVQKTLARVPGGADKLERSATVSEVGETLVPGSDVPAIMSENTGLPFQKGKDAHRDEPTNTIPTEPGQGLESSDKGETTATPRKRQKTSTAGGFRVDFINMGEESHRAKYEREERTIYVNLDHPQIAAARSLGGTDDATFRRLSYEVAFSEYAIALSSELAGGDWYQDITDPIVDIRETINRISRSAASLYAKV